MNISGNKGELEAFQLILQTREHPKLEAILDTWRLINADAVSLGKKLYDERFFSKAITHNRDIGELYDQVILRYLREI